MCGIAVVNGWVSRPSTSKSTPPNTAGEVVFSEFQQSKQGVSCRVKTSFEVDNATGGTGLPTVLGANAEGPLFPSVRSGCWAPSRLARNPRSAGLFGRVGQQNQVVTIFYGPRFMDAKG